MSENLENQNTNENVVEAEITQNTEEKNDSEEKIEDTSKEIPQTNETNSEHNQIEVLSQIFKTIADKKREFDDEVKVKQDYLTTNLESFNTEEYLQNQDFRNIYAEAFDALGTKLDTKEFVNLLDKYVESRIALNNKRNAIKNENDKSTDGLNFQSGVSKTETKLKRLQDIPDDELASYIAKYI